LRRAVGARESRLFAARRKSLTRRIEWTLHVRGATLSVERGGRGTGAMTLRYVPVAARLRVQGASPPLPSWRAAGRVRRAVVALAFGGTVGALAAVAPGSVAGPAAATVLQTTKLPAGFPKSVPLPKGGTVLNSTATKLGEELGVNVALKASVPAATRAYAHQLKVAGFKVTVGTISASGAAIQASGHGWEVDVTIEPGSLFHLKAGESYIGIGVQKS
jgi:hypothetical protein